MNYIKIKQFILLIISCLLIQKLFAQENFIATILVPKLASDNIKINFSLHNIQAKIDNHDSAHFEKNTKRIKNIVINNWRLGFFSLYNIKNINLSICNNHTLRCSKLVIDKKSDYYDTSDKLVQFITSDFTTSGHTFFLKQEPHNNPTNEFLLNMHDNYTVFFKNIITLPKNISLLPQSLFIFDVDNNKFYKFNTQVNSQINSHVNLITNTHINIIKQQTVDKKLNSISNLDTPILPKPQKILIPNYNKIITTNVAFNSKPKIILCQVYNTNNNLFNLNFNHFLITDILDHNICKSIKNLKEAYILDITKYTKLNHNNVSIYINDKAGLFYARESLLQLQIYYNNQIPLQRIIDYPRYIYRGLMLDLARHYLSIVELKKIIDIMATHKLNTLRLHLSDDEAWRIELDKYPQLIQYGATRGFRQILGAANLIENDHIKIDDIYTHFYTKYEIMDLINYANNKQITIIPEIDMPSHARALKKSLANIMFDSTDLSEYESVAFYNDNVLPICKYDTIDGFTYTINEIIKNVADLFANQNTLYAVNHEISIGGDELPQHAFDKSIYCNIGVWHNKNNLGREQLFIKKIIHNLPDYHISVYQDTVLEPLNKNDFKNQLLDHDYNSMPHIWYWKPYNIRHKSNITKNYLGAITSNMDYKQNNKIIAFANYAYLDIRQSNLFNDVGLYWSTDHISTIDAFNLYKLPLNALGVEASLWTELIPNLDTAYFMLLPRLSAIAEASWSYANLNNIQNLRVIDDIKIKNNFITRLGNKQQGFLYYLNKKHGIGIVH